MILTQQDQKLKKALGVTSEGITILKINQSKVNAKVQEHLGKVNKS